MQSPQSSTLHNIFVINTAQPSFQSVTLCWYAIWNKNKNFGQPLGNVAFANSTLSPLTVNSVGQKLDVRGILVDCLQKPQVRGFVTFQIHGHCSRRMQFFFDKIGNFARIAQTLSNERAAWSNFDSKFPHNKICMLLALLPSARCWFCKLRVRNNSRMTQIENATKKDQKNFKIVYFRDCLMSLRHFGCSCDRQFVYFLNFFLISLITKTKCECRWLDLFEFCLNFAELVEFRQSMNSFSIEFLPRSERIILRKHQQKVRLRGRSFCVFKARRESRLVIYRVSAFSCSGGFSKALHHSAQ